MFTVDVKQQYNNNINGCLLGCQVVINCLLNGCLLAGFLIRKMSVCIMSFEQLFVIMSIIPIYYLAYHNLMKLIL